MQQDDNLKSLDDLIVFLGGSNDLRRNSPGSADFLVEHLHSARRSLLGSMPQEYSFNLEQAREAAGSISDKSARGETRARLQKLIDQKG